MFTRKEMTIILCDVAENVWDYVKNEMIDAHSAGTIANPVTKTPKEMFAKNKYLYNSFEEALIVQRIEEALGYTLEESIFEKVARPEDFSESDEECADFMNEFIRLFKLWKKSCSHIMTAHHKYPGKTIAEIYNMDKEYIHAVFKGLETAENKEDIAAIDEFLYYVKAIRENSL